ncbi:isoleucine--tRNA ligase [Aerophototrophica crusticola]|uniref:Isoleucine--tRNA ligase n=1 Tax=Aerophototrophica crusticola TaxID=1709002 RepID=A0A858RAQ6_9PROT|nr:isoleucine--tRNA ligase [Rhodospirillaceae bacterium B3]
MTHPAETASLAYPPAEASPDFPRIEEEVQAAWKRDRIFEESVSFRPATGDAGTNEFVFYDGPPFANGLPHYGHLVTGFVKDLVPRYHTMKGRRVERRFGWDCHGLPAELQSEKELGISGRQEILAYGMERFNEHCKVSVQRFTHEWEYYVTRQGRWVDFQNDYKTMDLSFMESVMWAFKRLWDKGLIYEGYRVVPYSWAVQSPLSNFETRLDNSYRERQDPALTVKFRLDPRDGDPGPIDILAWTTTPWTLPSNLALAVGPEIDYALVRKGDHHLLLAEAALGKYAKELEGYEPVASMKGTDLAGRTYQPVFPFFQGTENAHKVLAADFVATGDGVGIVHMAPGFGEDDLNVCVAHGIPVKVPVDVAGKFTAEVPPYEGINVIEANKQIIQDLKAAGVVLRHETIVHNYPHCWRTDTPLIYKAVNSWYVEVSRFKDRMAELNKQINWIPGHVKDGLFGNWLENARDWNISRNRFWGAPIPVWKSDDARYPRVDVYGSLEEIERDFGVRPADLHRPGIDALVRPNPDDPTGKSMMRRVEDVLDCWFESGSMPFAQLHYPFENKEQFEKNFPADFIVEYVAQTRGWFYTLMVLSTALFDSVPFKNVICHGVVLDEHKQKLSKRLRNYPDPQEVLNTYGADALRWYLVSSPLMAGGDLAMPKDARGIAQALRQGVLPLWNAYSFFTLYANIDGVKARQRDSWDQVGSLDRYILAKTRQVVEGVTARLDAFDLPGAYALVPGYYDALNNWYIRRSRQRFWRDADGAAQDKQDAYDTLFTCLVTLCKALAPMLPHVTERIYTALTGEKSVHLADWPDASALPADAKLVAEMDLVRDICAAAMSIREQKQLRTRLPLRTLTIVHPDAATLESYSQIIAGEVNVKAVTLSTDIALVGSRQLAVNAAVVGPKVGPAMKSVMAASKTGQWTDNGDGTVSLAGVTLGAGEFDIRVQTNQGLDAARFAGGKGVVVLDTTVDAELEKEGWARDFVRAVQSTRKDAGFHVTDRIRIGATVPAEVAAALEAHAETVKRETLAVDLKVNQGGLTGVATKVDLSGTEIELAIAKA